MFLATNLSGCVLRPWHAGDKPALRKSAFKDGQFVDTVMYANIREA
jgi:hypothetical protein